MFRSDANKQSKEHRVYTINLLKETLGDDVCNELLFVHAYQAVIQFQGFTASEKSHPSKQISRGHIRSLQRPDG